MAFYLFFLCLCHLISFSSTFHLLFDSIGVLRWCWRLPVFLLDARRGDTHTKFFPLAGRALGSPSVMNGACATFMWLRHTSGSSRWKLSVHHNSSTAWGWGTVICPQGKHRPSASVDWQEREAPLRCQWSCLLHGRLDLASMWLLEVCKPSSRMDISIRWEISMVGS